MFLSYTPLVGSLIGFFGAKDVWGWAWWQAAALYIGLPIFIIIFSILFAIVGGMAQAAVGTVKRKSASS